MKKLEKSSKLKFKKFQIATLRNPQMILGGNGTNQDDNGTVTDTQNNMGI